MDGVIGFFQDLGPNLQILFDRSPQILQGLQITVLATILGGLLALKLAEAPALDLTERHLLSAVRNDTAPTRLTYNDCSSASTWSPRSTRTS